MTGFIYALVERILSPFKHRLYMDGAASADRRAERRLIGLGFLAMGPRSASFPFVDGVAPIAAVCYVHDKETAG
jgi:hypothetical protein